MTLPVPGDFAPPPSAEDHVRWAKADADARPARLERLRSRFKEAGVEDSIKYASK